LFWRDILHIEEFGIETVLISTRKPPTALISQTWSEEAIQRTHYLYPLRLAELPGSVWELIRTGPTSWWRCLAAILNAEGLSFKGRVRLLGLVLMGAELVRLSRIRGFRHVHVNSCADSAHIAMFAHLMSGLTYSLSLLNPLQVQGPNQKEKWKHSAFGIVITRQLLLEVQNELKDNLPPHVDLAPLSVDKRHFARPQPYQPWEREGPCWIFSCGRLNPSKGHDDLIRAVALLRQRGLDARLRIAGEDDSRDGSVRPMLQVLIAELRLNDAITLLGAVSEEVVIQELFRAHVFALASWAEPLGVAIVEAMAARLPVVVTGAGGVREFIDDGVEGILVDPKNPGQMADALERVLRDPELAQRLGTAGEHRIAMCFELVRYARIILGRAGLIDDPEFKRSGGTREMA
jgi:glycosyltransferase involved in cell wall biosynthesis